LFSEAGLELGPAKHAEFCIHGVDLVAFGAYDLSIFMFGIASSGHSWQPIVLSDH